MARLFNVKNDHVTNDYRFTKHRIVTWIKDSTQEVEEKIVS